METLKDAYGDGNSSASTMSLSPALDAPLPADTIHAPTVPHTLPESDHANGINLSPQTLSIEDLPLPDVPNQAPNNSANNNAIESRDSPSLPLVTDGDDDDEEEDEDDEEVERSPKRQKQQLSADLPKPEPIEGEITETPSPGNAGTPLSENGSKPPVPSGSKSSKKSKKKSKDVWSNTSRKGKKKTKHADNNVSAAKEDKVFITPIPRFPDKTDDSPDAKICLSKVYKAEKVELSEDRLTAGSTKGYRMVRATRGVTEGAWYFEIKVVSLGETGHTRLGWSMEKGDLQAPVGYDGNSFGYRDIDGTKVHKAVRDEYGEGYKEGDVIGFYISLPDGGSFAPTPAPLVWYKGQRYVSAPGAKEEPPKVVPGSEISYYKNGICQGVAFKDLYGGCYYPAASMYTLPNQPNCVVKFNFGPEFERFPEDFGDRPIPRPMIEVPYQSHDGRVENGVSSEMK